MAIGDIHIAYGTDTAVTITLASLASAGARQSDVIDNSTNEYVDYLVTVKLKTGASAPSSDKAAHIYVAAGNGTIRAENAGATDAAITLSSPSNATRIGYISMPSASTTYYAGPFSVAAAFGGALPKDFAIIVENRHGQALTSTAGDHAVYYTPVRYDVQTT